MTDIEFLEHFASWPRAVARVDEVTFDQGCWLYKAELRHYPRLYNPATRKYVYLHRVSLSIKLGVSLDSLKGKEAAHRCDRPRCVNPEHLFLATHAENMADMGAKGRTGIVRLIGDESPHARMTKDQVIAVLAAHAAGESIHSLSRRLPVTRRSIQFWVRGVIRPDAYAEFHGQASYPDLVDLRANLDDANYAAVVAAVSS